MIRLALLLIMAAMFYLFARDNTENMVVVAFLDSASLPIAVHWLLLYAFIAGGVCYALFTLPEQFQTWRTLYKHRKRVKKMGKNMSAVITAAKTQQK